MSSELPSISASKVEITNISAHGVWLLVGEEELFLSYEDFPWFKDTSVGKILNVRRPTPGHFYWSDLDVTLDWRPFAILIVSRFELTAGYNPVLVRTPALIPALKYV